LRRNTFAIWGVYFFNWVAWFAIILWLPSVLVTAGLAEAQAANGTKIINGAALIFILPLAWYIPRLPVRGVIIALLLAGVAAMAALAGAGQQWTLVYVLIGMVGFFVGGPQICLNYLAVSIYPTAIRATGIGWAIGIGRVGTILGAAAGGPLLDQFGVRGFFLAMALPLLLSAAAAMLVKSATNPSATEG
jgi:AAHS family 4-hydroxybenzoate transporter-like MFS transporter